MGEPVINPSWNLPIGAEPDGQWSGVNVTTVHVVFLLFVKYTTSGILSSKFLLSKSGLGQKSRFLTALGDSYH